MTWADYGKFIGFPFKVLGIVALVILFVMAATSHDFWLGFLTPRAWKALHMSLYVAYGLVVMHVALGIMQYVRTPLVPAMLTTFSAAARKAEEPKPADPAPAAQVEKAGS